MQEDLDERGAPTASLTPSAGDRARIRDWLETMEDCVRGRDFECARELFAADALSFGTYATRASGRAALEQCQWRIVWPHTRGFSFALEQMRCFGGPAGFCVAITWESLGVRDDGTTFSRCGRATLVLAGCERLQAVHSHFSLDP